MSISPSASLRSPSPPLASGDPPLRFAPSERGVRFRLGETDVEALSDGALWVGAARTLVVSDLHLEKGSAFAGRGRMLPPYDTRATLARLAALIGVLNPAALVSLGDSFHDRGGPGRMDAADVAMLRALTDRTRWIWIEGNHDPEAPLHLGGEAAATVPIADLVLRHEPTNAPAPGEVAGHLHPCAKVAGRGRAVRARSFATDGRRLVMPAFGAFTGGLNLCAPAFAPLFPNGVAALMLLRGRVFPTPGSRLLPDGAQSLGARGRGSVLKAPPAQG